MRAAMSSHTSLTLRLVGGGNGGSHLPDRNLQCLPKKRVLDEVEEAKLNPPRGGMLIEEDTLVAIYEQCGGRWHTGGTRCGEGFVCAHKSAAYSQCVPDPAAPGRPLYAQCGGRDYKGAAACAAGTQCVVLNEWYSQCKLA